jgi:hypothetical protein
VKVRKIGIFLTLTEPSGPMKAEAAGAGKVDTGGVAGTVPRIQIVTIADAMALRDRAVRLPALRQDTFKKATREEDPSRQRAMDL